METRAKIFLDNAGQFGTVLVEVSDQTWCVALPYKMNESEVQEYARLVIEQIGTMNAK